MTVAGIATAGFDAHHRKANSIQYSLRADEGTAVWNCFDESPDKWTSQFVSQEAKKVDLSQDYPWIAPDALQSPAPLGPLPPPELQVLDDSLNGETRTLRMRISSPRLAPMILVRTEPDTRVLGAVINGKRVPNTANAAHNRTRTDHDRTATDSGDNTQLFSSEALLFRGDKWRMIYAAPPPDGFELILELPPSQPLKLTVEDVSYELPVIPGLPIKPRPDYMMPAPLFGASDSTLVKKSFTIANRP